MNNMTTHYIYVDINQWEMLLDSLAPEVQATYKDDSRTPRHKGRPVIMMAGYYKGEHSSTVGFVRETAE